MSRNTRRPKGSSEGMPKWKKLLLICSVAVLCIALFLAVGAVLVFNRYYNMMHYISQEDMTTPYGETTPEWWETDPPSGDSDTETDLPSPDVTSIDNNISSAVDDPADPTQQSDVTNILLIGIDTKNQSLSGRSDVTMILSVNRTRKQITLTSILRDSYVHIPGHGNNRINASYAFGRVKLLVETVEENFGIAIDRYALVNFTGFADVINAVGGLTITVNQSEAKLIQEQVKIKPVSQSGNSYTFHMSGYEALKYVRNRSTASSDFGRTQRQQAAIFALMEKAKSMSAGELDAMLTKLLPLITTDLTRSDLLSMISQAANYLSYERQSLQIPVKDGYAPVRINGASVLSLDFKKNRDALLQTIYGIEN